MTEQTTPRPIVVAVDFSQESEAAFMSAAELANIEPDTPIVVLHVAHEPAHKPGFYHRRGRGESLLPIEYLARRALTEFMAEMRLQYPEIARLQNVQEKIVSGLPVTRIPELARKVDAQLIIVGCTGRSRFSRLCYGSVSDKVKSRNDIPVRVVRLHGAGGEDTQQVKNSEVLREKPRNTAGAPNQLGLG